MALHPGAVELQDVAVPVTAHAEALGKDLRDLLDPLARMRRGQGMRVADVDAGHAGVRGAGAHCDRRPGTIKPWGPDAPCGWRRGRFPARGNPPIPIPRP